MRAKGIIFDCDGTLADTMPAHYGSWLETLKPYGVEFPEAQFWALGGWSAAAIAGVLSRQSGVALDPQVVAAEKNRTYLQYLPAVQAIPEVVAVAREHHGKLPMAVATGSSRWLCEEILRRLEISHLFDAVVAVEDVPNHKPAPDSFLEAARRIGISPPDCLVYEDTDAGIEAARRAGMEFVDVRLLRSRP
jgi:beta-phosphoglucomutase family hydrolase